MLAQSLRRTRQAVFGRIASALGATELNESTWVEIEALLIQADMGVSTSLETVKTLRQRALTHGLTLQTDLRVALAETLRDQLKSPGPINLNTQNAPNVVLLVGVNGSGKTTSAAKLARRFEASGWQVMIAAADTYRAAATEQIQAWGKALNIPVVAGQIGSDPGAVAYDAIQAARARGRNLLLVDTAGRLHTKFNLMEELKKIHNVVSKNVAGAPHEVWLVLDGTTGQNALTQVSQFKTVVGISGVILTKLDGTAKGGIVFAIERDFALPVRYVGVGEGIDDLVEFDGNEFVSGLLDDNVSQ